MAPSCRVRLPQASAEEYHVSVVVGGCVSKSVLVFDSGVGGLTVYDEIRQLLPGLHFLYVFDNARFPYGELPADELVHRCVSVIKSVVALHTVDLVVIACNTASTQVLPALRAILPMPVVGVVPAIKPAARMSHNACIGLLATPATISRPYIDQLIENHASHVRVLRCGSTELVLQAERKLSGLSVEQDKIEATLQHWRDDAHKPDTLVLGCTHFPLLKEEIAKVLPHVRLIDSGAAIARRVHELLVFNGEGMMQVKESFAYCTLMNHHTRSLQPAMQKRGLGRIEELDISCDCRTPLA